MTRTESDECLILASDGLWDVMSNEEVMGMARRMLRELRKQFATAANGSVSPAQYVAEGVLENTLRTSTDNVSVIVVDLKRLRRRLQQKAAADIWWYKVQNSLGHFGTGLIIFGCSYRMFYVFGVKFELVLIKHTLWTFKNFSADDQMQNASVIGSLQFTACSPGQGTKRKQNF